MTEPLNDVHLKSIDDNIMAMADHTRAMLQSTSTLRRRVEENTLLLRQILDLLPPLPNTTSPDTTEVVQQVAGPDLLNQRPDQLVTVTAAGDRHPEISGDLKESVHLLSSFELDETKILDDANVFDQMPKRMCITSEEIIESVEPEPVPEKDELIPTPPPNSMIGGYEDYSVCSFVVSTLTNSYTLRFPFCTFSIVDEYLSSLYLPHASEFLGISMEFERCFVSSILRDRWGLFLKPACINFKLLDPDLWVMRPTHDLGESKAFDPGVADQPFDANPLIANDVCVVIDFNSMLVVIAYGLTKKVSSIDRKQALIFSFDVGNFDVYLLNVVANFDEAGQVLFQDGPSCLTQRNMADEFDIGGSHLIVYSQVLTVTDFKATSKPIIQAHDGVTNYKRFCKASIQSGTNFNNLVLFSIHSHEHYAYGSGYSAKSVTEANEKTYKKAVSTAGVSYTHDATILRQFDLVWTTRFGVRADVDDRYIVDVQRVLHTADFNEVGLWVTSSDYNAANLDTLRDFADKILDSMLPLLGVMRLNHGFDDCKSFDPGISEYLLAANRLPANKLSVALVQNDNISTGILMHVGTSPFCLFSVMFRKPLIHGNEDMVEAIDEYLVGQLKDFVGMKLVFAIKKVSRLEYTEDEQTKKEILKEKFEGLCKVTKDVLGDKGSRATTTMNSIHKEQFLSCCIQQLWESVYSLTFSLRCAL